MTTPTVSAPSSRAISATIGAPPVPVPPPSPAVTKTMSAPLSASLSSSRLSFAGGLADARVGAGAEALRALRADLELDVGVRHQQRLRVRVDGDELAAREAGLDHAADGVRAAAAHADDLDHGEVVTGGISHLSTCLDLKLYWSVRPYGSPGYVRRGALSTWLRDPNSQVSLTT